MSAQPKRSIRAQLTRLSLIIVAVSVAPAFVGVIKAATTGRRAKAGDPVARAEERVNEAEYQRELTEEKVLRAEAAAKAEARRRVAAEREGIEPATPVGANAAVGREKGGAIEEKGGE